MSRTPIAPEIPAISLKRIRVWDLPLRLFHWSLLLAVAAAIGTGLVGGDFMPLHGIAGQVIIGLLAFRLVWGLVGSSHARFSHFAPSPARILAYLQGRWQGVGHNPLGALSVFGLIGLLGLQAGLGLFTNDEISFTGPLAGLIDEALSIKVTGWHHLLVNGVYALIGLHVLAIAFYGHVKKEKLVGPMVTGWKAVQHGEPTQGGGPVAFALALAIALGAVWVSNGGLNPFITALTADSRRPDSAGSATEQTKAASHGGTSAQAAPAPAATSAPSGPAPTW